MDEMKKKIRDLDNENRQLKANANTKRNENLEPTRNSSVSQSQ